MKLIVFCFFTVCCWTWMTAAQSNGSTQRRMLQQILQHLKLVKNDLQHSKQMLYTPPSNVTDCCCLPALKCFRSSLEDNFRVQLTNRHLKKLYRNLGSNLTMNGMNFCGSEEAQSTCQECSSHPQENTNEFFNRLESLIQRAIVRLSTD